MEQAVARRETFRNAFTRPAAEHDESGWAAFAPRSRTTSTRRPRSRSCTTGRRRASSSCCGAAWRSSGSSRSPSATRRRPRSSRSPSRRAEARAARDFETSDRLRDELAALGWEMRDRDDGFDLVRA